MTTHDLQSVEARVHELAARIGATGSVLPTFGRTEDGARPHVEIDASGFHFVVVERGLELTRITTRDLDELLWHVFESVTFSLACTRLSNHREAERDSRRELFARQVALLATLSPAWAAREAAKQADVLSRHPFDDASEARVNLTVFLQGKGHHPDDAWRMACERYPLPEEQQRGGEVT